MTYYVHYILIYYVQYILTYYVQYILTYYVHYILTYYIHYTHVNQVFKHTVKLSLCTILHVKQQKY